MRKVSLPKEVPPTKVIAELSESGKSIVVTINDGRPVIIHVDMHRAGEINEPGALIKGMMSIFKNVSINVSKEQRRRDGVDR